MEENKLNLPKDFFKQFNSKEQFQEFFNRGVNEMLQGELMNTWL
jgi:putative transposase